LFAVRYEQEPSQRDRDVAGELQELAEGNVQLMDYLQTHRMQLADYIQTGFLRNYDERMKKLSNHQATIALFDDALRDRSQWPANDHVVRQHIFAKRPLHQQVTKTSLSTTGYMRELDGDDSQAAESEDEDEEALY
jgi:hypothetical protein